MRRDVSNSFKCPEQWKTESGTMSGHYFHQDLFIAKKVFNENPNHHVDIGSRIDGFVAHLAVFREIEIIDIREQNSKVSNILFRKADLMQLPDDMVNYCDSISALQQKAESYWINQGLWGKDRYST